MRINTVTFENFNRLDQFLDFCKSASLDSSQSAATNMWSASWKTESHTLPYKLLVEKLYSPPHGIFHLLIHNDQIIACSGAYRSKFSKDILIAGARTWVSKNYRNLLLSREYLLPAEKKFAIDNGYKAIALSFNDYNKNIIEIWKRSRLGEKLSPRQPYHMFYNNFNEVEVPVEIQYTSQWVIYEKLDPEFNFDWNSIRCR